MRKVVLQMMTTLNGRLDDPDAWLTGIGDDLYTDINKLYATFDTVLVGQTTYQEMAAYWPGAETQEGNSENDKSMARKMNRYKKFVFTSSDQQPSDWANTEFVTVHNDADITHFVNDLKSQSGGVIHLAGGAELAQTFARLGLVDEYRLFVYPVVSAGKTLFEKVEDKQGLELVSATPYQNGIVGLFYRPKSS